MYKKRYLFRNFLPYGGIIILLLSLFPGALITGCDQEPLFWDIAHEYPPIEPIIGGHPSQIVSTGTGSVLKLYVSNGFIWEYDAGAGNQVNWIRMEHQPPGRTNGLAVAAVDKLFALNWDGAIHKFDGGSWTAIPAPPNAEQIFGAGNHLFVGFRTGVAGTDNGYSVACFDASSGTEVSGSRISGVGLLRGAANISGTYYLGIQGFRAQGGGVRSGTPPGSFSQPIAGFPNDIIGLASNSTGTVLYAVSGRRVLAYNGSTIVSDIVGPSFTGAAAVWSDGPRTMLLLGLRRQSGSFGYGYREIVIGTGGNFTGGFQVPGSSAPSSVIIGGQYNNAIGKRAVNYLYVMPHAFTLFADDDSRPVIFASTVNKGLWSYRRRGGRGAQWNGEDNSP